MRKIIKELLVLLWKVFRVVLWKWLKPLLGKLFFFAIIAVGVAMLVLLLVRGC